MSSSAIHACFHHGVLQSSVAYSTAEAHTYKQGRLAKAYPRNSFQSTRLKGAESMCGQTRHDKNTTPSRRQSRQCQVLVSWIRSLIANVSHPLDASDAKVRMEALRQSIRTPYPLARFPHPGLRP
eukprot:4584823-Pleurochrysis_carterae.AAC.6